MFELSSMGTVYKWRVQHKDMKSCVEALKHTKAQIKNDGSLGVVVTCGGDIQRFYNVKWHKDKIGE